MPAGPSSDITRCVVEEFAPRYLGRPAVLSISDSRQKVVKRDGELALRIGLRIDAQELLPDIILADLAPAEPLFVFVEVVATDGPIDAARKAALTDFLRQSGQDPGRAAFVTAVLDRDRPEYRRVMRVAAPGTYVWAASEPTLLIHLEDGSREGSLPIRKS
jgi:hypothetical protein